jgi:hypothetical protein
MDTNVVDFGTIRISDGLRRVSEALLCFANELFLRRRCLGFSLGFGFGFRYSEQNV